MDQSVVTATTILSDSVPKEHQGIATSLVATVDLRVKRGGMKYRAVVGEPFAPQVGLGHTGWIMSLYHVSVSEEIRRRHQVCFIGPFY